MSYSNFRFSKKISHMLLYFDSEKSKKNKKKFNIQIFFSGHLSFFHQNRVHQVNIYIGQTIWSGLKKISFIPSRVKIVIFDQNWSHQISTGQIMFIKGKKWISYYFRSKSSFSIKIELTRSIRVKSGQPR
jgi:hypothetical protein